MCDTPVTGPPLYKTVFGLALHIHCIQICLHLYYIHLIFNVSVQSFVTLMYEASGVFRFWLFLAVQNRL